MFVRYDTPNEHGEHRRERNERHDQPTPDVNIPEDGRYLWDWYWQISDGLRRVYDGVCSPVPWSEYFYWAQVSNVIVHAAEYDILRAMDAIFCEETNAELQAYHERLKDERNRAFSEAQGG